jgi:hypothetical protein
MTPEGLVALFFASAGNILLPILLNAAQLAVSRRWPDSDIPQDLERIKVIVNVAGAAVTSIVAALKRWSLGRVVTTAGKTVIPGATASLQRDVEANEGTMLLRAGQNLSYCKSQTRRSEATETTGHHVTFDAGLIDVNMKQDQAQLAVVLPVS